MSNPSEDNAAQLARVLQEIEKATEQAAGWLSERDRLVGEARALGGSHRQIASRADLSHAGAGEPTTLSPSATRRQGNVLDGS